MKYIVSIVLFLILYACTFDSEKEVTLTGDSWLHRSQWQASTFNSAWIPLEQTDFSSSLPVTANVKIDDKADYFAFDIYDKDSTLGSFDSITVRYKSNIDLFFCAAIRWHDIFGDDDHGFVLKDDIDKCLKKCDQMEEVTFYPTDFKGDWFSSTPKLTINQCNNFGIGNTSSIKEGDSIAVTIESITIF